LNRCAALGVFKKLPFQKECALEFGFEIGDFGHDWPRD